LPACTHQPRHQVIKSPHPWRGASLSLCINHELCTKLKHPIPLGLRCA
jgi:hypothetical protein